MDYTYAQLVEVVLVFLHYSFLLRTQILDSYMHLKTSLRKEIIVLF